jgi:hypothetical protein
LLAGPRSSSNEVSPQLKRLNSELQSAKKLGDLMAAVRSAYAAAHGPRVRARTGLSGGSVGSGGGGGGGGGGDHSSDGEDTREEEEPAKKALVALLQAGDGAGRARAAHAAYRELLRAAGLGGRI